MSISDSRAFSTLLKATNKAWFWKVFARCFGHDEAVHWRKQVSGLNGPSWDVWRSIFVQMLSYRRSKWLTSAPIRNRSFRDQQWGHMLWYSCSQPECHRISGTASGLRMTPTGIFCERHYMTLPACRRPGCLEPATTDPDWNPGGFCRACDPELQATQLTNPKSFSMISIATEVLTEGIFTMSAELDDNLHNEPKNGKFIDDGGTKMEVNLTETNTQKSQKSTWRSKKREKASVYRGGVWIFPQAPKKMDHLVGEFMKLVFYRALGEEIPTEKIEKLLDEIDPPEKPTSKAVGEELGLVPHRIRNFLDALGIHSQFALMSREKIAYRSAAIKIQRKLHPESEKTGTRKKVQRRR